MIDEEADSYGVLEKIEVVPTVFNITCFFNSLFP